MFKHRISVRLVGLFMSVGIAACGQTATPPSSALPSPGDEAAGLSGSPIVSPSVEPGPVGFAHTHRCADAASAAGPAGRRPRALFSRVTARPPQPRSTAQASSTSPPICGERIRYATSTDGQVVGDVDPGVRRRIGSTSILRSAVDGHDALRRFHAMEADRRSDTCGGPRAVASIYDVSGTYLRTRRIAGWVVVGGRPDRARRR